MCRKVCRAQTDSAGQSAVRASDVLLSHFAPPLHTSFSHFLYTFSFSINFLLMLSCHTLHQPCTLDVCLPPLLSSICPGLTCFPSYHPKNICWQKTHTKHLFWPPPLHWAEILCSILLKLSLTDTPQKRTWNCSPMNLLWELLNSKFKDTFLQDKWLQKIFFQCA